MDEPGPQVVALLAGAASFFFSMVEASIEHYSASRLLDLAKRRGREDCVPALVQDDEKYLLTLRTAGLLARVTFVLAVFAAWIPPAERGDAWALVRAGAVAAAALLIVTRFPPMFLGRIFAEEILYYLRPALPPLQLAFSPITMVLHFIRVATRRLVGRPQGRDHSGQIQEEILSAVEEGEMEGVIGEDEADMIERALHLQDADVADSMTPRTRMFALEIGTHLKDAVNLVSEQGHSRVPIYRDTMDEIVGVLYAKDLLVHWGSPEAEKLTLARIARKPFFVPETKRTSQLLDEFKARKTHLAVVLDEYGGTAGIITIEDILEEIVGEIEDEYDETVGVPLLEMLSTAEAEVDAQVHVDDLGDALDVEIPSDEFDTVGGLVFTALGRIPSAGDEFEYLSLHVTVLDANERAVNRVRVVKSE